MNGFNNRSFHNPALSRGMTLVEIMVAITISLILLAGIMTMLISSKTTYLTQESISRIQENGRYAIRVMAEKIRSAGFTGCSTGEFGTLTNTLNNAGQNPNNFALSIEGYEASGTGLNATYNITATYPTVSPSASNWSATGSGSSAALPADLLDNVNLAGTGVLPGDGVIAGNDVLVIRAASDKGIKIDRNNDAAQLFIDATNVVTNGCPNGTDDMIDGICPGDILMVSDCTKSRVFQATGITTVGGGACANAPCANVTHSNAGITPGNATSAWGGASAPASEKFGPDAEIMKMYTTAFYIGVGANNSPALFMKENDGVPQELIDNVENMQVVYGEDTSVATPVTSAAIPNIATRYVTAAQVGDWNRVVTARVSLLLRSNKTISTSTDTGTYMLTGSTTATATTINPVDDKRFRRIYTTTIKLRNKGLR